MRKRFLYAPARLVVFWLARDLQVSFKFEEFRRISTSSSSSGCFTLVFVLTLLWVYLFRTGIKLLSKGAHREARA